MDAQGAIDSLLGRLTTVLVSEAQLLGGLRGDVEFISDEMESMNGLLMHLAESHNRDNQVRAWMKQVAGLSRDCEGNVELYIQYVGGAGPGARKGLLGSLLRTLRFVRTMSARHRIATRIRELKIRARDVGDRRKRYGVTVPPAPAPARTIADTPAPQPGGPQEEEDLRRRELLYGEPPDTTKEDSNKVRHLLYVKYDPRVYNWYPKYRLICIEGAGSEGKTTIARKVFEHPSVVRSFDHRVWINNGGLSRSYPEVHNEILEKLGLRKDDMEMESQIKELLSGKSILIVLDTVDDEQEPTPLSAHFSRRICNFFEHYGVRANSAVIMTSGYFSTILHGWLGVGFHTEKFHCETRLNFFRNRAFDLAKCEGSAIVAVLVKCYHDPFAAQLFLRLLYVNPHRAAAELETLRRALEEKRNSPAKVMLMFSYNELPSHHKNCLMYLSIFPRGHVIMRADLLRRWICEGLITKRSAGTSTLDDQAERIFDSLVIRGFICPGETSAAGKIKSFTLNPTVHEFIVEDVGFVDTSSRPELAHRFSINSGVAIQEESVSEFESDPSGHGILTTIESLSKSAQWQFLKVLDLRGCTGLKKKHLNSICNILVLKYLSLRNTDVTQLPKDIEKLQCLQTLDIRQTEVQVLATKSKSVVLPMLKHLLAGKRGPPTESNNSDTADRFQESLATVRLPRSIRRMEKLEVLSHVKVAQSDDLTDVGKLLHLRKLGVILQGKKEELQLLFQQIKKLHGCLHSLSIQIDQQTKCEGELPSPPKHLQSLNISGIKGGLHLWIAGHDQLTKITLSETGLGEDALRILGKLRILRCLRLRHKSYVESQLNFKEEEFKSLKSLVVEGSNITSITFEAEAAPKLEMIVWSFVSMGTISGLNHLPKLKKLEVNGDSYDRDSLREETPQSS